jgi:hypothetical protein
MKNLIILDTYPNTLRNEEILIECINSYRELDSDILLVSHFPISKEVQEMVDFVIYDKNNEFLPAKYTPHWWCEVHNYRIDVYNGGHSLPICRNMMSSISFAKSMRYNTFIFSESDVILNGNDLKLLSGMVTDMYETGKEMLFFKPEDYRDCGSYVYETLLFAGRPEFFLDVFEPPLDLKQWSERSMGYSLELTFYEKFNHLEEVFEIVNSHSSVLFKDSKVNVSRYGLFTCEFIENTIVPSEPVLFIMNGLVEKDIQYIDIYQNGSLIQSLELTKDVFWYRNFTFNDDQISIFGYNDIDKKYLFLHKEYTLNESFKQILPEKGTIKYGTSSTTSILQ